MNRLTPTNPGSDAATLVDLIREQCTTEVAELRTQSEERARRIRATAEAQAESIRAAAHGDGAARGRRQAAKVLAVAEADSHREQLWAREALIQDAITRARNELAHFPAMAGAAEILAELIRDGLRALPPGPVHVRLPEPCESLLDDVARGALAAGGWVLHFESGVVAGGGVIVDTEDGSLRFDNSIDARIRRRTDTLRRVIADALFSEEGTA